MFSDKMNKVYNQLNETDLLILSVILRNFEKIPTIGVEELARMCNTSRTSVLRISKKLEFSGYGELRNYIKWEVDKASSNGFASSITPVETETECTISELKNNKQFEEVVEKIISAKRIFIYGTGQAQRNCANEIQRLFLQAGKYMFVIKATAEFQLLSEELNEDDLVFVISLSGEIERFKDALHLLKMKNTAIVSITSFGNNLLAAEADYRLYAVTLPIQMKNNKLHNSFVSFFAIAEFLFRSYLEHTELI